MRELSIFVDESGSDGLSDRYYLLTVVMHDQSDSIADSIEAYESALRAKGLPDIPFHASPLMNGKDLYSGFDLRTRKMMLGSFRVFFRHMPVRYHTFAYATRQFASLDKLCVSSSRFFVTRHPILSGLSAKVFRISPRAAGPSLPSCFPA